MTLALTRVLLKYLSLCQSVNSDNSGAHIFSLMQWGTFKPFIAFQHSRACKILKKAFAGEKFFLKVLENKGAGKFNLP